MRLCCTPDTGMLNADEQEGADFRGLDWRDDAVSSACTHVRQRLLHSPIIAQVQARLPIHLGASCDES